MKLSNVTLIIQGRARGALKKLGTLSQGAASKALRHANNMFCKPSRIRVKRTKMILKCSCYDIGWQLANSLQMLYSRELKNNTESWEPNQIKQQINKLSPLL